jgi:hypothetical protein
MDSRLRMLRSHKGTYALFRLRAMVCAVAIGLVLSALAALLLSGFQDSRRQRFLSDASSEADVFLGRGFVTVISPSCRAARGCDANTPPRSAIASIARWYVPSPRVASEIYAVERSFGWPFPCMSWNVVDGHIVRGFDWLRKAAPAPGAIDPLPSAWRADGGGPPGEPSLTEALHLADAVVGLSGSNGLATPAWTGSMFAYPPYVDRAGQTSQETICFASVTDTIVPTHPLFIPLAFDTILFALTILVVRAPWVLGMRYHMQQRIRRGLCPFCGYASGSHRDTPCPECGVSPGASTQPTL